MHDVSCFSITDFVKSGHKSLEGELHATLVACSSLFYKKENRDVRGEKEFSYPNKKNQISECLYGQDTEKCEVKKIKHPFLLN